MKQLRVFRQMYIMSRNEVHLFHYEQWLHVLSGENISSMKLNVQRKKELMLKEKKKGINA